MGDESGHRYKWGWTKGGGWPIFDGAGHRIDERASFHRMVLLTKVTHGGQRRTYFKGACACGWEHEGWRRTEERAEADYRKEHEEAA